MSGDRRGKVRRVNALRELERTSSPSNADQRRTAMKTLATALVALSVLASVVAPANAAFNPKGFYDQQDRSAP